MTVKKIIISRIPMVAMI